MAIIRYEVGYDRTNVLGSGTDYIPVYQGRSIEKAMEQFENPRMTYMCRTIYENGVCKIEYYNRYRKLWE